MKRGAGGSCSAGESGRKRRTASFFSHSRNTNHSRFDVWIRRIMQEHYLHDDRTDPERAYGDYDRIRTFAKRYFGPYCGYAQEYLYGARLS
jgi:3-methyladenine DNA glycosylase/8-oxoguanine DNA glycosylase